MAEITSTNHQVSTTNKSHTRYWRRTDQPGPWKLVGLLTLLGLLVLFFYGAIRTAPAIEAQTAAEALAVLRENGLETIAVEADGQDVLVKAEGGDADAARIYALASVASCETWIAGRQTCPRTVRVEMAEMPQEQSIVRAAPTKRFHNFNFRQVDGVLTLSGEVPDEGLRRAIVDAANKSFPNVNDELRVTGELATDSYDWAVDRAWSALTAVSTGEVEWFDGRFSAAGSLAELDAKSIERSLSTAAFAERLGELRFESAPTASECDAGFAAVFERATIQFRSGSAEISPSSGVVLADLAEVARACPLPLVIEGHTDSAGSEQFNRSLSLARAEAVVAALVSSGVEVSRMSARGFGSDRPISDNTTAAGRAQNRRIEISVAGRDGGEE